MKLTSICILFLAIAGCAGRASNPVNVTNTFDSKLSCQHLLGEFENNGKRLAELRGESSNKVSYNLGYMALNPLAGVFLLDLSDTQKVEAQAIYDRSVMLVDLMKKKSCKDIPVIITGEDSGS